MTLLLFGAYLQNFALLALILTGEHDDSVAGLYMNIDSYFATPPLQNFRSEGQDLGVILFSQLSGYWPKDTGTTGIFVLPDDNGCVFIKADISAVFPAQPLRGAYDYGTGLLRPS